MEKYHIPSQPFPGYSISPNPSYGYQTPPPPPYSTSPQPSYHQQHPSPYQPQQQHQPQPPYPHQPLPNYATSPLPSHNNPPPPPRTLHIYHEGLSGRRSTILDSDKRTPLYNITASHGFHFSGKPHITITSGSTGAQIATITYHTLSSNIDLKVHSQPLTLSKTTWLSSAHEFTSLATGSTLKWKRDSAWHINNDMICIDEKEQVWARFQASEWAMRKEGRIEVGPGVQGTLMDEIVTSGVAMVAWLKMQQSGHAAC